MPRKKLTNRRKLEKELDRLWSLAIKERDGHKCVRCGSTGPLNSHHINHKHKLATRWDLNNGLCLCIPHHNWYGAHSTQYEYQRKYYTWLDSYYYSGRGGLDKLELKSNQSYKPTIDELEALILELENG